MIQCNKNFYHKGGIFTKKRIDNFDFIRCVCAWIIVIYHFAGSCDAMPTFAKFPFFFTHANGIWGENTIVNIFFMISGASLFYNHPDLSKKDLKKYYFSRFKGIFPMFYILWLFLYYQNATAQQNLLFRGPASSMILTLFGMDGYLSYRFAENYYFIGEWFLGALVLLYLFYPLLTWCIRHCKILTSLFLGLGTISMLWISPMFLIQKERNLIVCMFAFWLGMLFVEYRSQLTNRFITLGATFVALFLLLVKVPIDPFLCAQAISIALFLALYKAADYVMRPKPICRFIQYSSNLSYAIFLLQHVVIVKVLYTFIQYKLTVLQEVLILILVFIVTYIFASVLTLLNKTLVSQKAFQRIQEYFYK